MIRSRHEIAFAALAAAIFTSCKPAEVSTKPKIGFAQVSSVAPLDEARAGFFKALADSGYVQDSTITIIDRNAQGDIPTLSLIMNEFLQQDVALVTTVSSVATQAALKTISDRPIVFGAVANPYIIGAGKSPTDHRPNVTGAEIPLPVDSAVGLAHSAFPEIKTWGTLFDPADPFAEFYLEMAKQTAERLGVHFVAVACTTPGDIASAVQALKSQGVGGVVQIPSIMIGGGMPAVVKSTRGEGMILIATSTSYTIAPIAMGLSFYANGYDMGLIAMRVLKGESPAKIPFARAAKRQIIVNLDAAKLYGITIPRSVLDRADSLIGAPGVAGNSTNGKPSIADATPVRKPTQNMPLGFWLVAITQGLAYSALAWGVYLSSRVLRFADITPDGSFPLGAAVAATLIMSGVDPLIATAMAMLAGMVAGYVTGVLHTRFGVTDLLAGILVMTALYSINLHVMGRSNVSLLDANTLLRHVHSLVPVTQGWHDDLTLGALFLVITLFIGALLTWYLRTDFGMALRAVGDNPAMITAQGVDKRRMIELGLALANGLVAVSGALIAQQQGFADVGMGVGTLVAGMAAVIMGETLRFKKRGLGITVVMVAVGAILFRSLAGLALRVGLNPIDLKLATAVFVLLALALPKMRVGKRLAGATR